MTPQVLAERIEATLINSILDLGSPVPERAQRRSCVRGWHRSFWTPGSQLLPLPTRSRHPYFTHLLSSAGKQNIHVDFDRS